MTGDHLLLFLSIQAPKGFLMILDCNGELFFATHTIETYLGFHQVRFFFFMKNCSAVNGLMEKVFFKTKVRASTSKWMKKSRIGEWGNKKLFLSFLIAATPATIAPAIVAATAIETATAAADTEAAATAAAVNIAAN